MNNFFTNTHNHITTSNNIIELNNKKHISSNEKINYKKVTKEQWTDFHNFVWDEYIHRKSHITQNNNIQTFINATYDNFTQSINCTIKSLHFPILKNNSHQYEYTHEIRVLQNDLYYILKLIRLSQLYFSVNNNSKHLPLLNFWNSPKKLNRLKRISSDLKIKMAITQTDQEILKSLLTPPPTFINHNNQTSYIDIIFGSQNLINYITFGNILLDAPINTDHKLIYISIN